MQHNMNLYNCRRDYFDNNMHATLKTQNETANSHSANIICSAAFNWFSDSYSQGHGPRLLPAADITKDIFTPELGQPPK